MGSAMAPEESTGRQGVADQDMESLGSRQQSPVLHQSSTPDRLQRSRRYPVYQLPELNDQPRLLPSRQRRPPGRFDDYIR